MTQGAFVRDHWAHRTNTPAPEPAQVQLHEVGAALIMLTEPFGAHHEMSCARKRKPLLLTEGSTSARSRTSHWNFLEGASARKWS